MVRMVRFINPNARTRIPGYWSPAVALLIMAGLALLAGGCSPEGDLRQDRLQRIARWQDQRLAPGDSLLALLKCPDAHVRLAAAHAAGLIGRNDVVPQLGELLEDPSLAVSCRAAFSLGLLGDTRAVARLNEATRSGQQQMRLAALEGLAHLPNDGTALLATAAGGPQEEVQATWNSLRNRVADVDSTQLVAAMAQGMSAAEGVPDDTMWRILRCVEALPDTSLTPLVARHCQSLHPQVRVHAYRALTRLGDPAGLAPLLAAFSGHDQFDGRTRDRVDIAGCRALGRLAGPALNSTSGDAGREPDAEQVAALLIAAAGRPSPHVVASALAAMQQICAEMPLPAEAAWQESLLPVWRIRLARCSKNFLASDHLMVRAAAIRAFAATRGGGGSQDLDEIMTTPQVPFVAAACLEAIGKYHSAPLELLATHAGPAQLGDSGNPEQGAALVRTAALAGLNHLWHERRSVVPDSLALEMLPRLLNAAALANDFVVATTAVGLLGDHPSPGALATVCEAWVLASGPGRNDVRRSVLAALDQMLADADDRLAACGGDSAIGDSLLGQAVSLLQAAWQDPDIRLRKDARETARNTGLLPDYLIPTEASLEATLPAVTRDRRQPPVAVPHKAPKILCSTARGDFVIQLAGKLAPNTCDNMVALIEQEFYADLTFHRVVPDFVIQGGCPRGDGWGGPGYMIRSEWSRAPYTRGVVGIAHDGKDTGGSQFFVTISEQPHLNGRYTVIGNVIKGLEVIDMIEVGDQFTLTILP